MSSCCPVCYKVTGENVTGSREQSEEFVKLQKRFFELFERFLNQDGINIEVGWRHPSQARFLPSALAGSGMVSCGQCLELMESFCELFHQLKTTELLINWKVEKLKNVMRSSQRRLLRVTNLQNFLRRIDAPEKFDDVVKARRWLIKNCCEQLRNAFPKLLIQKWSLDDEATPSGHLQPEQRTEATKNATISNENRPAAMTSSHFSVHEQNQNGESPSVVNYEAGLSNLTSPTEVASKTALLTNNSGNVEDNDPRAKIIVDVSQIKTHWDDDDDPMSTNVSDQEFIRDDNSENDESIGRMEKIIKRDVDLPIESHEVIQIQLANPPELPTDFVSSGTNLIPDTPHTNRNNRMPRLRSTHRCQHCGRTFSTDERLQLHIQQDHKNEQSDMEVFASDNDQAEDNDNNAQMDIDIDSSCFSSSSSEEEEDNLESDNGHSDTTMENNEQRSNNFPPAPLTGQGNQLRFKCPDCSIMFADMKALLCHRQTSKSCGHSYDPTANVKVEVFALSKKAQAEATFDDSNFVDVFAIVDLPQKIHICEDCDVVVYSVEDMEAHMKLHGTFQCNFCDVTKSYAPDLALHENQEHFPKMTADGKKNSLDFNCARCSFGCQFRNEYIAHHLSEHLSLAFNDPKCTICKTNSESMRNPHPEGSKWIEFQLGTHLKTHHDLSNVSNVEELKICDLKDCRAYFLKAQQLTEHLKLRHGLLETSVKQPKNISTKRRTNRSQILKTEKPSKRSNNVKTKKPIKWSIITRQFPKHTYYRLKCPDCNGLFCSPQEILTHRKTSKSCSGSYDPSKSVKVEYLVPTDPKNTKQGKDSTVFTTVAAIIDLPQAIFSCKIENCGSSQYSLEDMETHKKLHGSFPCKFCKVNFTFAPELSIHELQHFKKEKGANNKCFFSCPRCDFKSDRRCKYIRHHMITHLSLIVNQPVCPICKTHGMKMSFELREHTNHFKVMHDLSNVTIPEDIIHCTVPSCEAYFLSTNQLTEHLSYRHNITHWAQQKYGKKLPKKLPSNERKLLKVGGLRRERHHPHKCKDCERTFAALRELWAHRMKYHVDLDKAIRCTVPKCDKLFESTKQLNHHIKYGVPYHKSLDCPDVQCQKCGKSFNGSHPSFLDAHLKTHERDPRLYCCELCGKAFREKAHLDIHFLSHSGPESWKYECGVCKKKCRDPQSLKVHMRTHSNEKPFVCQICGVRYAHRHNLRIHVNSKHGDVAEDKAKKYNRPNATSRKGIKRKKVEDEACAKEESEDSDDAD